MCQLETCSAQPGMGSSASLAEPLQQPNSSGQAGALPSPGLRERGKLLPVKCSRKNISRPLDEGWDQASGRARIHFRDAQGSVLGQAVQQEPGDVE